VIDMKKTIANVAGSIWASPLTLVALIYSTTFWILGWYVWLGVRETGLVWTVDCNKSPKWLLSLWRKWEGHAIGQVVVLKRDPAMVTDTILKHELEHVHQCMVLGLLQPVIYAISLFALWVACPMSDPYYDNPFEIDARRKAGQLIDVTGALRTRIGKNYENA